MHMSSLPASSPDAESGDATPREPASRTATTIGAQPTALAADFSDPERREVHAAILRDGVRTAAGQSANTWTGLPPSKPDASYIRSPRRETRRSTWGWDSLELDGLPNEILMHILTFLDTNDLLNTSRVSSPLILSSFFLSSFLAAPTPLEHY